MNNKLSWRLGVDAPIVFHGDSLVLDDETLVALLEDVLRMCCYNIRHNPPHRDGRRDTKLVRVVVNNVLCYVQEQRQAAANLENLLNGVNLDDDTL